MPNKKLYVVNERMLKWMEYSIQVKKAEHKKDWCEKIGFAFANLSQLKRGQQGFTLQQIEKAAKLIKGNINWLFNLETQMLLHSKPITPIELLREATSVFETHLGVDKIIRTGAIVNKKVNTKGRQHPKKATTKK